MDLWWFICNGEWTLALAGLSLAGVSSMETTHVKLNKQQHQLKTKTSEADMEARTADKKGKQKQEGKKAGWKNINFGLLSEASSSTGSTAKS